MTQSNAPAPTGDAQSASSAPSTEEAPSYLPVPVRAGELAVRDDERGGMGLWQRLVRALFPPSDRESIREDLNDALQSGGELHEAFSPDERAMLHNILRLREVRVEDVMVPRADVEAVDQTTTLGRLLEIFEESGHSRMPVYAENLDDPRGMIHIRDLLAWITKQARAKRKSVAKSAAALQKLNSLNALELSRVDLSKTLQESGITRKVLFVPASMLASDLMQRMQANRIQMALVIDEYGGTDGLVSLEDIVEMVVGDIADEHDDEDETLITKAGEDIWVVDAKAELEDLADEIGKDFDIREQSEEVDTIGGLIFSELGRVPARGEVVQALAGFEFHVMDADPRRVKRVRIIRKRQAPRRRPVRGEAAPKKNSGSGDASAA
ncbi:hemolysin family protein [uncultured Hoeflea sp.]|uniref:hemolysin family protein n=1 Tax=uncultured Hoeflea sp. TaxID=538666 RepID=UPI0030EC210B|tara:strand:- start:54379 stop:55521 length:1143 start_codon:yes stop_codon:yes gene_type:complete